MKKSWPVPSALLFALLLVAGSAHEASPAQPGGMSLDGTLNYATEPAGNFDGGWGFDLGFNVDLKRLGVGIGMPKDTALQGRVSLGYYEWEDSPFGIKISYERIPLFVGGRIVWNATPAVQVYGQLGLEISFDEAEIFHPVFGVVEDDDTNLGLVPGVGVLFPLGDRFYLGGALNWHIISDDYFTLGLTAGFNLP